MATESTAKKSTRPGESDTGGGGGSGRDLSPRTEHYQKDHCVAKAEVAVFTEAGDGRLAEVAKRAATLSTPLAEEEEAIMYVTSDTTNLFVSRDIYRAQAGRKSNSASVCDDVQDNKDNVDIIVVAGCRPLLAHEIRRGVRAVVMCDDHRVLISGGDRLINRERRFDF